MKQKKDQMKYEDLTTETLKAIKALGWGIEKTDGPGSKNTPRLPPQKLSVNYFIIIFIKSF